MKKALYHIIILFCFGNFGFSQGFASAKYSRDSIRIGEQLLLQLGFKCQKVSIDSVNWPQFDDYLTNSVEIIDRSRLQTVVTDSITQDVMLMQNFVLTSFEEGENILEPILIKFKDSIYSTNVSSLYVSTVAVDTTNNIYDIKPIQEVDYKLSNRINDFFIDNWYWIVIVGLLSLILILLYYFYSKRERQQVISLAPIIPAHIPALKKLKALADSRAWENEDKKGYYSAVTDTVRKYLEERFEIQALEETTIEIIRDLKYSDIVSKDKFFLEEILKQADMVKFAKYKPDNQDGETVLSKSIEFVERTKELTANKSASSNSNE
ncbi:MAG: hypothetical protein AB8B72_02255 [Crocinitomicaceae bacterium]